MHRSYQLTLLFFTCVLLVASCIGAHYLKDQPLQHLPTVLALIGIGWVANQPKLSDASMTAIVLFWWLHILGARYIYSYVPYDQWTRRWLGFSIDHTFGFTRNHYDRIVHFAYGLLATLPQVELLRRRWHLRNGQAHFVSFAFVLAAGAAYEIAEWLSAVLAAPEWAERYNGQQGDIWDSQKDMLLAALGALFSSAAMLAYSARQTHQPAHKPRM